MYSNNYEDYLTSEFNRLNPGLDDLEKAERRSRDAAEFDCDSAVTDYNEDLSTAMWAEAEMRRGLAVRTGNEVGQWLLVDPRRPQKPAVVIDSNEADLVFKQIEGHYEQLQCAGWTPAKAAADLKAQAEAGDVDAQYMYWRKYEASMFAAWTCDRYVRRLGHFLSRDQINRVLEREGDIFVPFDKQPFYSRRNLTLDYDTNKYVEFYIPF